MTPVQKLTLTTFLSIVVITAHAQSPTDSTKYKSERINPYNSIKTSIFVEKSLGDYVKSGTAVGFEIRKFTGLRHFFFGSLSYGQYDNHKNVGTSTKPQSYNLSFQSANLRVGTVLGTNFYNAYVGARYLFDVKVSESFYSYSQAKQMAVSGNVTKYVNRLVPVGGACFKFRLGKAFILDFFYEFHLTKVFKPLRGNWIVPDSESPFLIFDKSAMQRLMGASIHMKL